MDTKQLSSLAPDLYIGLDVGGTFTDLVVMDDGGRVWSNKAPTPPGRLEQGVQDALDAMLIGHGIEVPNSTGLFGGIEAACKAPSCASSALSP